jgi:hypothetical protein
MSDSTAPFDFNENIDVHTGKFCARSMFKTFEDETTGKTFITISPYGEDGKIQENETWVVPVTTEPEAKKNILEVIKKYGWLPLTMQLCRKKGAQGGWILTSVEDPSSMKRHIDNPAGEDKEFDYSDVASALGKHLYYKLYGEATGKLQEVLALNAPATVEHLEASGAHAYFTGKLVDKESSLFGLLSSQQPPITEAEMEAFYQRSVSGKSMRQLMEGKLPHTIVLSDGTQLESLCSNLLKDPGDLDPRILAAVQNNRENVMAIALQHAIARVGVADHAIHQLLDGTNLDGTPRVNALRREVDYISYDESAEGNFLSPLEKTSRGTPAIIPHFSHDGGKSLYPDPFPFLPPKDYNSVARELLQGSVFAAVNMTQVLSGAQTIFHNAEGKTDILTSKDYLTEDNHKKLFAAGALDGTYKYLLDNARKVSTDAQDALLDPQAMLQGIGNELAMVTSFDPEVMKERVANDLYTSAAVLVKKVADKEKELGFNPQPDTKDLQSLYGLIFLKGLATPLEEALTCLETTAPIFG